MAGKLRNFFSDRQFVHSSAGGNEPRREITVHDLIMNKGSCNKQLDFIYFFNRQLQEHDNDVTRS